MASRAALPASLAVPPKILRLVTQERMSSSDPLVWRGIPGRSRTRRSSVFSLMQPGEKAIEKDVAGFALKDAVEAVA